MQIITGKYRARKLKAVDSTETRPTLARVKESVFNLIQDKISNSTVLDLFAGSGAFGAECISRGAKKVFFVDSSDKAISTIKVNTTNMTEDFEILKMNFVDAINLFFKKQIMFDLVYLDPPYELGYAIKSLKLLLEHNLLKDGATIVIEHKYINDLQNLPKCYIIEKSRKYGIVLIDVLSFKK